MTRQIQNVRSCVLRNDRPGVFKKLMPLENKVVETPRTVVLKQEHSPCQRAPGHVWRGFWLSQWRLAVPLASRGWRPMFYMHSGAVENPCAEQERVKRHNDKKQKVLTKSTKKILRDIGKPKCGLY